MKCSRNQHESRFALLRSFLILLALGAWAAPSARAADIDIEVRGIKVRTGQIHAALFDNAADFSLDLAFRGKVSREGEVSVGIFTKDNALPRAPAEFVSAPANARTIQLHIGDVPPGTYVVALYQDVNDDGKLDTNLSGMPLEPWGMSNNPPKASGRGPTWEESQFVLPPEGIRLVIELH